MAFSGHEFTPTTFSSSPTMLPSSALPKRVKKLSSSNSGKPSKQKKRQQKQEKDKAPSKKPIDKMPWASSLPWSESLGAWEGTVKGRISTVESTSRKKQLAKQKKRGMSARGDKRGRGENVLPPRPAWNNDTNISVSTDSSDSVTTNSCLDSDGESEHSRANNRDAHGNNLSNTMEFDVTKDVIAILDKDPSQYISAFISSPTYFKKFLEKGG